MKRSAFSDRPIKREKRFRVWLKAGRWRLKAIAAARNG
jgi:hypothetical protein